jgi:hypothetical protein
MAGIGASMGAHGELAGEGKEGEWEEGEGAQVWGAMGARSTAPTLCT